MDRPVSIIRFEQLYLAGFAVGVIGAILEWSKIAQLTQSSILGAEMSVLMAIGIAIGFAISLLLWYFIARRGSAVAKWIATVFAVFSVIGLVLGIVRLLGGTSFSITTGLSFVAGLLKIASITFLFRPDTRTWFGEPAAEGAADEAL